MRRIAIAVAAALLLGGLGVGTAKAYHFYASGWRDKHYAYPAKPSGRAGIVSVFGQPCNAQVNDNRTDWIAQDDGVSYIVRYHLKLGGWGKYYGGDISPGVSTNLNNDVRGHIRNDHLYGQVTRGIYGYACRMKTGSTTAYSTHAWGIAVDISSAANPYGDYTCNTVTPEMAQRWNNHGWRWGNTFGDCMHFQYARDY